MPGKPALTAREQRLVHDLITALGSSLDIQRVLSEAYTFLSGLVSVDHGALCTSRPGCPGEYDWAVAELPPEWFGGYADMAPHDFVRQAVLKNPNRVLRDEDMIPRGKLEANFMYRRSRELGMPLEQVMAVLLSDGNGWHGGVTLYRAERCPFAERDREILQFLAPQFTSAIRNCRQFANLARKASVNEALLDSLGYNAIIFEPPATEVERTPGVTALLQKWFAGTRRAPGGVPAHLSAQVKRATSAAHLLAPPLDPVIQSGEDADLCSSFLPLHDGDKLRVALVLQELPHVPPEWRGRLTPTELEVVKRTLRGWDNMLIAEDLHMAEATVKKHLQHVFDKLGVDSRAKLMALARQKNRKR